MAVVEGSVATRLEAPKVSNFSPGARTAYALLLFPAAAFIVVFFVYPIVSILSTSFFAPTFTLENYIRIFTSSSFGYAFLVSFKIAALSTIISLALSYPVAYSMLVASPAKRNLLMIIVLIPFWTNILIRVYAWMVILQNNGVINKFLMNFLGVTDQPMPLMYNTTGVLVGMVHYLVPMNILILYGAMKSIDLRLLRAAQGLGASPLRAFLSIFVPLSVPGVLASAVLIFVVALGFYVTPALLGGRSETTVSIIVGLYFTEVLDWPFGAALSTVLLVLTLMGLSLGLFVRKREAAR